MSSLGEKLRQARESQGLELSQLAESMRISRRYLEAIEAGDLEQLPAGFFRRSFVKQYARALNVPESEIAAELDRLAPRVDVLPAPTARPADHGIGLPPVTHVMEGPARPKRRILGTAVALVAVVVACAALYAVWLYWRTATEAEPAASAAVEIPAHSEVAEAQSRPAEARQTAVETPSAAPATEPPPPAGEPGPLWFRLRAREETWVRVSSGDRRLFEGILQPEATRSFSGLEFASVLTGNAGGLEIIANGRDIGPLGPRGHIRTVTLTPGGSEIRAPETRPAVEAPEPDAENAADRQAP